MHDAAADLVIDLGAVVANWCLLCDRLAPSHCGAVIKADAHGLGATSVARALLKAGCREFFVALVDEGIRLREAGTNAYEFLTSPGSRYRRHYLTEP